MRGLTSGSFVKTYDLTAVSDIGVTGVEVYACERRFLERLQGTGLVPELQSVEEEGERRAGIRLEFHLPLVMWMSDHPGGASAIKAAIDDQLRRLHEHGVCHRDVHEDNLVVDRADTPLFIDFELAVDVSPSGPCYDRLGAASGVPVPPAHTRVGLCAGVWWDSVMPDGFGLGTVFGPLGSDLPQPG